ncbi:MAG TPA: hypothetical protein VNY05_37990 [Candidatus Acidoferrales bacterium]|jgi:hypothetical protein|nr:hypothetical protein [Candidatus Acidoferrales bacterium]
MSAAKNPLSKLDHRELLWLAGILKDACRERLEKNQVSQAFEDRLYQRGPVEGRPDPRPFLKIWEPRYRKFLTVASELQALLEAEDARTTAQSLRAQVELLRGQGEPPRPQAESLRPRFAPKAAIGRHGSGSALYDRRNGMIEENAANPRRKTRSR